MAHLSPRYHSLALETSNPEHWNSHEADKIYPWQMLQGDTVEHGNLGGWGREAQQRIKTTFRFMGCGTTLYSTDFAAFLVQL